MIDLGIDAPFGKRDAIDDGDPNPRGQSLANLSIIFVSLAGFFVILRLFTRYFHTKIFGADDALIVVALVRALFFLSPKRGDLDATISDFVWLGFFCLYDGCLQRRCVCCGSKKPPRGGW
jgi:hypothetical protein